MTSTGASLLLVEDLSAQRWTPTDGSIPTLTLEPRTVPLSKGSTESAIVQLRHHGAFEHLLFVLFPNEICLVHTQNRQVLYSAIIDTGSPIVQVKNTKYFLNKSQRCFLALAAMPSSWCTRMALSHFGWHECIFPKNGSAPHWIMSAIAQPNQCTDSQHASELWELYFVQQPIQPLHCS